MSPTADLASKGAGSTKTTTVNGSLPAPRGGGQGQNGGARGGAAKGPMPHLDDILHARAEVDGSESLPKLLAAADALAEKALTFYGFNRPDLALAEYVKSIEVATMLIPEHGNYVKQIQGNEGGLGLGSVHQAVLRKIKKFDSQKVKDDIMADNKKSGVLPLASRASPSMASQTSDTTSDTSTASSHTLTNSSGAGSAHHAHENGFRAPSSLATSTPRASTDTSRPGTPSTSATSPPRVKPAVHPKPQKLHGNALRPAGGGAKDAGAGSTDLATRFANLRPTAKTQAQDPRIKTQPIIPSRPAGHAAPKGSTTPTTAASAATGAGPVPPSSLLRMSLDTSFLPDMPKVPDAIYSPARGTVSIAAAALPSSTPRGLFTRTNSSLSAQPPKSSPALVSVSTVTSDSYFPTYGNGGGQASTLSLSQVVVGHATPPSALKLGIPKGDAITPEELVKYMGRGAKDVLVLLIDVRPRENFDEGHIMSQCTICIEPEILLRENVSAEQIHDSMVLSPAEETRNFDRRNEFDIVVFYDANSTDLPSSSSRDRDFIPLLNLRRALVDFNYPQELKRPPKLLKGGLEAWTDLLGVNSLQTSATAAGQKPRARPAERPSDQWRRLGRPTRYRAASLLPDEVKTWQETLREDERQHGSPTDFVRTTSDFLRRFPPASAVQQESMTAPVVAKAQQSQQGGGHPPPQPNSLIHPQHHHHHHHHAGGSPHHQHQQQQQPGHHDADAFAALPSPPARPAPAVPRPNYGGLHDKAEEEHLEMLTKSSSASAARKARTRCGLINESQWCYANSTIQALFATPGLGDDFAESRIGKVPRKVVETMDNPQLMVRMLSGLLYWMRYGAFEALKAKTLMNYCKSICLRDARGVRRPDSELFGGPAQQDANEFLEFLFAQLSDETNVRRGVKGLTLNNSRKYSGSSIGDAMAYWNEYKAAGNESIVDRYFGFTTTTYRKCNNCGDILTTYEYHNVLSAPMSGASGGRDTTLSNLLTEQFNFVETVEGVECDACRVKGRALRYSYISRFPDVLIVRLGRFAFGDNAEKVRDRVSWDLQAEDLTHLFFPDSNRGMEGLPTDHHFVAPFRYECYAVIVHDGSTISSGHYTCWVRDADHPHDRHAWVVYSDTNIRERNRAGEHDIFRQGRDKTAYIAFFKRKQDV